MKIILDSTDIDEAMEMYLRSKGIVADDASIEIDYTKGRGDTGLTAEISVIRIDHTNDPDSDNPSVSANELPEDEPTVTERAATSELDSGDSDGVDTSDSDDSASGADSLFGRKD